MLRRFFLTALIAAPLGACLPATDNAAADHPADYVGRWVEVFLGSDSGGFELFADGTATSIDQPDLTYISWRTKTGTLFLTATDRAGKTTEVEYSATLNDTTRLHLTKSEADDWPRIFRMID